MNPKVWTFGIWWNESKMAPWFLKHYSPWVDRMVVFLEPSSDGTEAILRECPKVDLRPWPYRGLNDELFLKTVNSCYKEARGKADWVAFVDADELIFNPDMLSVLEKADGDIFPSTGYALISPNGWPPPDFNGQIYDAIHTGVPQPNYNKKLLFRPKLNVVHDIGRHSYEGWPKHDGKECSDAGIKLLHCHYVGGVEEVAARHRRNYARALDKKFAWNFDAAHNNDPKVVGSLAWMQAALTENRLVDVFTGSRALKKLHFGCGGHKIAGFENYDIEVNLRGPLPFQNGCASHVFLEHVLEHIGMKEAWNCLAEIHRALAVGGRVRIAIPDPVKLWRDATPDYCELVRKGGFGSGTKQDAVKAAIFCHGHEGVWTQELLDSIMQAVGFSTTRCVMGQSDDPIFCHIEQHGKTVGDAIASAETSVVEGVK